jgi:hypothetical protein
MNKDEVQLDPFAGMEEVASNWFKLGKVGDWIKGTLTGSRVQANALKNNEDQTVYEILSDSGSFHMINADKTVSDKPTIIPKGEYWNISGKAAIDAQMRNVKPGTIIAVRFVEERPATKKGNNPTKVVKVLVGGMDTEYHGQDSTMNEAE